MELNGTPNSATSSWYCRLLCQELGLDEIFWNELLAERGRGFEPPTDPALE